MSNTYLAGGIALLVIGALVALGAGAAYASCASIPTSSPPGPTVPQTSPFCGGDVAAVVIGIILAVIGVLVLAFSSRAYTYVAPPFDPAIPAPLIAPVVVQRQTVMVRCRYCGQLVDPTVGHCSACGAPL